MPPHEHTQDQQARRACEQYGAQTSDLAKNVRLTALHGRYEVLFYRLIGDHLLKCCRSSTPPVSAPPSSQGTLRDFQVYARPAAEVAGWQRDEQLGGVPQSEVIRQARPTILIAIA
ncbi:hypothetical protein [Streptomyces sp. NPDC005181]|uniref:hypothetical protein n=1 Tax=Streptomyces sp. NPDC005181 TaxID=3156869 RepID=UPI0033AB20F6